jgi:hypothetical protein
MHTHYITWYYLFATYIAIIIIIIIIIHIKNFGQPEWTRV